MKLRFYQKEIVDAQNEWLSSNRQRGSVYAPTGSGKTFCFSNMIKEAMSRGMKNILVVHPRIALSIDQQTRFLDHFSGIPFTGFHSGEAVQSLGDFVNTTTTNRETLVEIIAAAQAVPASGFHITFSSYASLHKIADMNFDLIICDEAHYLTQAALSVSLDLFKSKVMFYTATPIYNDKGVSMDNRDLFGNVEADIEPKRLIESGYVLAPRLRFLDVAANITDEDGMVDPAMMIAEAFRDQSAQLNEGINCKMLVAMPATTEFENIVSKLPEIRELCGDIDVYYVTASMSRKNAGRGETNRAKTLDAFQSSTKPSIIIHCDTLSEGIDVDGMTGAFIFRTLTKAKFMQTVGRCARPLKADMDDNGDVIDMANRIKPNCLITIPTVNGDFYGNIDAQWLCEVFAAGGYDEITTMLSAEQKERKGSSNPEGVDPIEDMIYEAVIDAEVREVKLDLEQFMV